jgi:hypothetical protein
MVSQRSQQLAPQQKRLLNTNNTATDTTIRLHAQGLSFSWGERRALSNVSLDLNAGEMFGLLGPNGAGKTTLISLIAGLITPDQGELSVLGYSTRRAADLARKNLGFVFQSVSLDRFMTARFEQNASQSKPGTLVHHFSNSGLVKPHRGKPFRWTKKTGGHCARHGAQTRGSYTRRTHHRTGRTVEEQCVANPENLAGHRRADHFYRNAFNGRGQQLRPGGFSPPRRIELAWYTRASAATLADWFVWKMNGGAH